jgi:outer membrane lipoprotein SlyB
MTVVSSIRTSTGKLAAGAFLALSLSLAGCASTSKA